MTVVLGLGLYSLTILVRNVLDGLNGVPADVRESATGMGYAAPRLLFGSSSRWRCPRSWPGSASPPSRRWR